MEQVRSFVKRLHIPTAVGEKALEYYRLAEVKCSSSSRSVISPSCLAIVCIDLACVQLGEPFDKKSGQRLSGVSSKAYLSSYQTVEKLLNVSSQTTLKELAVRFGCLEAQLLADTILEGYKARVEEKYTAAQKISLDLSKTLYLVAALYCACKLLKIRCEKSKFQTSSTSTKQVFQNVLDEMNLCAPKNADEFKSRKRKQTKAVTVREDNDQVDETSAGGGRDEVNDGCSKSRRETLEGRIRSNPTSQLYLEWKENILRQARERLLECEL